MKIRESLKALNLFEKILWSASVLVIILTFFAFQSRDYLTLCASLIGVTSLIFCAKGYALGQLIMIIFSVFYGIISFKFKYYGEMITYLGMTAPMALVSLIQWLRHPFEKSGEVKISRPEKKSILIMLSLSVVTTFIFYFILKYLGNASLLVSTFSVTTSFLASYLTALRSPYYALAYAANDVVLIVLWIVAATKDLSSVPMIACFAMFLINDLYGFINWRRMEKKQTEVIDGE